MCYNCQPEAHEEYSPGLLAAELLRSGGDDASTFVLKALSTSTALPSLTVQDERMRTASVKEALSILSEDDRPAVRHYALSYHRSSIRVMERVALMPGDFDTATRALSLLPFKRSLSIYSTLSLGLDADERSSLAWSLAAAFRASPTRLEDASLLASCDSSALEAIGNTLSHENVSGLELIRYAKIFPPKAAAPLWVRAVTRNRIRLTPQRALLMKEALDQSPSTVMEEYEESNWYPVTQDSQLRFRVDPEAGRILARSRSPLAQRIALSADLDEETLRHLIHAGSPELLVALSHLVVQSTSLLPLLLRRVESLPPSESRCTVYYNLLSALRRSEVDPELVSMVVFWAQRVVSRKFAEVFFDYDILDFVSGVWEGAPLALLLDLPLPERGELFRALLNHLIYSDLETPSPLLLELFDTAPGSVAAWVGARPRHQVFTLLAPHARLRLAAACGSSLAAWEVALSLAENFEGSLLELSESARLLA